MSDTASDPVLDILSPPEIPPGERVERLSDLSPAQWRSGIAAWLGWLFDGLDMHLYTLVATPFVAMLMGMSERDERLGTYTSLIQAAFLVGWALGGGFFGRIGDRMGRSRALMLTILTYAIFTGLSFFAQTWWHLLIFRFLAALGIGGEWAVGASLLSETWPAKWRPWIAATLQSAVNCGVLLAALANSLLGSYDKGRYVFLVGVLPALLVLWIRRAVPETEQWESARLAAGSDQPSIAKLFQGAERRVTVLTILICSTAMTAHWAFMFWSLQHLRKLPGVAEWSDSQKTQLASLGMISIMLSAIVGNYVAGFVARWLGFRRAISLFFAVYFVTIMCAYGVVRDHESLLYWFVLVGMCQGVFGLFTMYLPPLFPTLLRTTGAGFCYNIGRIVAAVGTVVFGLIATDHDPRLAILYSGFLVLPAAALSLLMPEPTPERAVITPVD